MRLYQALLSRLKEYPDRKLTRVFIYVYFFFHPGAPPGEWRGVSNDTQAELTRANDILEAPPGQRLSRSAAMAGMAADRFQASLSPALGPARGLGAGPAKGGAEASRGGPLAPG